jgi:hypothetical protein
LCVVCRHLYMRRAVSLKCPEATATKRSDELSGGDESGTLRRSVSLKVAPGPVCGYPSSNGQGVCQLRVAPGGGSRRRCERHTCMQPGCGNGKPSRAARCSACDERAARAPEPKSNDDVCVVCMEAPKKALLQHGSDGHLCVLPIPLFLSSRALLKSPSPPSPCALSSHVLIVTLGLDPSAALR